MAERRKKSVQEYLQLEQVQQLIQTYIDKVRAEATVTIRSAASIFDLSEHRLRNWEVHGFLSPQRPGSNGRRLYKLSELDKLAVVSALIKEGCAPADIPSNIDEIWQKILANGEKQAASTLVEQESHKTSSDIATLPINQRIERAKAKLSWRYFISHALRLSLSLISEEFPETNVSVGLILPLKNRVSGEPITRVEDLQRLGESLVGWLGRSRSSYTLLTSVLSFEYPTDYRILPLAAMENDIPGEVPQDRTLILLERRSKPLTLHAEVVDVIRQLLAPVYESALCWSEWFGPGMYDVLDPATDPRNDEDLILNGLADMVVRLGGLTAEGRPRWRWCCILLPMEQLVSIYQGGLVVVAQSKQAPYKIGKTTVESERNSPTIKALQGGNVVYLPKILESDKTIAHRELEEPLSSAIALPVGGEYGKALGVLYVASDLMDAFPTNQQRLLRLICRMVEEALKAYSDRQQAARRLMDVILQPELVDTAFNFKELNSENDFIRDVEGILQEILKRMEDLQHSNESIPEQYLSFIALDVDQQGSLANKYGDRAVRNLSREIGLRTLGQLQVFSEHFNCSVYHIYADRYYILLKDVSRDRTCEIAERLQSRLSGTYKIDVLRTTGDQPTRPGSMLILPEITVRLGVTSYFRDKLEEVLSRYPSRHADVEVRLQIMTYLEQALNKARDVGGNVVFAWDKDHKKFIRWSSPKLSSDLAE